MRVVFIGVVSTGWHCLNAVLQSGAQVVGIFTAEKKDMVEKSGMRQDEHLCCVFRVFHNNIPKWQLDS